MIYFTSSAAIILNNLSKTKFIIKIMEYRKKTFYIIQCGKVKFSACRRFWRCTCRRRNWWSTCESKFKTKRNVNKISKTVSQTNLKLKWKLTCWIFWTRCSFRAWRRRSLRRICCNKLKQQLESLKFLWFNKTLGQR